MNPVTETPQVSEINDDKGFELVDRIAQMTYDMINDGQRLATTNRKVVFLTEVQKEGEKYK